jgi:hypothetical protein
VVDRISLLIATLAAAVAFAAAVALGGATSLLEPTPVSAPALTSADPSGDLAAAPAVQVDTVYVPAPVPQQVIVKQVASSGGEGDDDGEGESD